MTFRAFTGQQHPHRAEQDLHVEPQRLGLDVLDVEVDALRPRQSVAPPDLGQPGEAGAHAEAAALALVIAVDLVLQGRTWSHDTHLTAADVEQLGQLVEGEATKPSTRAGD